MGRHAAYWQPLIDSGRMVVFGPVLDTTGSWGLGVVEAMTRTSCVPSPQAIRQSPPKPGVSRLARCSLASFARADQPVLKGPPHFVARPRDSDSWANGPSAAAGRVRSAGEGVKEQVVDAMRCVELHPVTDAVQALVAPGGGDVFGGGQHAVLSEVVVT